MRPQGTGFHGCSAGNRRMDDIRRSLADAVQPRTGAVAVAVLVAGALDPAARGPVADRSRGGRRHRGTDEVSGTAAVRRGGRVRGGPRPTRVVAAAVVLG